MRQLRLHSWRVLWRHKKWVSYPPHTFFTPCVLLQVTFCLLLICPWSESISEMCTFQCLEHGPTEWHIWLWGELISAKTRNQITWVTIVLKQCFCACIEKFNPDWKFQSWLEIFNLDRKFQSRPKISIPRYFCLRGPPGLTEKGSIENFNPRSIAPNFQSRRSRSLFSIPGPLGKLWYNFYHKKNHFFLR